MPARRIKGITVEIGGDTTGLNKALQGVNSNIRDTKTQLKDVERLLKLDPGNTELLRQKYSLLNTEIQDTETKLTALKEAEEQVQQQFERGDVSEEQYNALRREIIATESSLRTLRDQAEQTERAINGVDEQPVEDVADAAEDAQDALGDAGKEASNFGDYLKAGAVIEGVKGIASAISDLSEETAEYRKIMGSLEVSSAQAGYTAEETTASYKQLYGVLGDDQTAATTTANLQALGLSQGELTNLIDATVGAWARYGDSIPIDGLAEAINETAKVGTVTGTFADVLNWAGVNEDEFNEKLAACGSESERTNLIMQQLADQGLIEAGQAWRENNSDLVSANEAQANFMETAAQLSERLAPVMAAVKDGFNQIFEAILALTEDIDFEAIGAAISGAFGFFAETIIPVIADFLNFLLQNGETVAAVLTAIGGGIAALKLADFASKIQGLITGAATLTQTLPILGSAISILTNPIFLVGAAVAALIAVFVLFGDDIKEVLNKVIDFLKNTFLKGWEIFIDTLKNILSGLVNGVKGIWDSIMNVLSNVITNIKNGFITGWTKVWTGAKDIFSGIFEGLGNIAKAPINFIIGLLNKAIDGVNWLISGLNKIHFDIPDWVPGIGGKGFGINIGEIGHIPYLAKGGILSQGSAVVGEAGPELLTMTGNQAVVQPLTNQTTNHNIGGVNLYIYGAPGQDVNELADIISERINQEVTRKEAAFG